MQTPIEGHGAQPLAESEATSLRPLGTFIIALLGLALLKFLLGLVPVPSGMLQATTIVVTIIFVAVPVYALFRAGAASWTPKLGVTLILVGVAVHVGLQFLGSVVLGGQGIGAGLALSLRDVGFFSWCVGLGALLASLLKEKNLLIPVSVFLAAFDIFLVLTPMGPVKQILQVAPEIPQAMALNVPAAQSEPTGMVAQPFAIIGPADFVFMAMFFIALFKFGMDARRTAAWLAPAIVVYLGLALLIGPVPLLVPIGITVLAVNARHFKLNAEEWASTALVAAIAAGLIWWGATRPSSPSDSRPQAEPSMQAPSLEAPAPGGSPGQAVPDRSP
jgi:hypothetical protein